MTAGPVSVVAFGAISALGEGQAAVSAGEIGAPATTAIARDEELATTSLARPFAARARAPEGDDRATPLLERALMSCARELDGSRPGWRRGRVGLVLGTSSGGMRAAERAFAAMARGEPVADAEAATYGGPAARASRRLGLALDPCVLLLGACASSALAVGVAMLAVGSRAGIVTWSWRAGSDGSHRLRRGGVPRSRCARDHRGAPAASLLVGAGRHGARRGAAVLALRERPPRGREGLPLGLQGPPRMPFT